MLSYHRLRFVKVSRKKQIVHHGVFIKIVTPKIFKTRCKDPFHLHHELSLSCQDFLHHHSVIFGDYTYPISCSQSRPWWWWRRRLRRLQHIRLLDRGHVECLSLFPRRRFGVKWVSCAIPTTVVTFLLFMGFSVLVWYFRSRILRSKQLIETMGRVLGRLKYPNPIIARIVSPNTRRQESFFGHTTRLRRRSTKTRSPPLVFPLATVIDAPTMFFNSHGSFDIPYPPWTIQLS